MFSFPRDALHNLRELLVALVAVASAGTAAAQAQAQPSTTGPSATTYPGIGRAATSKEVAAWDIDVRPDFKGLPKGAGTVDQGLEVWESKCASCHGVFGESNEFFSPLVGGTTKEDIASGRASRLNDTSYPGRTTFMKLSSVSTLWDYIHRAMPWNAPKSLKVDEVYAATAYLLNMGGIVPNDFKLSDQNIADVQKLLPNRNGMTTEHGLWPGAAFGNQKPDVQAVACMNDCASDAPKIASFLPDFARDAHGNLAEQNRLVGAQLGADTTRPPPASLEAGAAQRGMTVAASAASAAATAIVAAKPASGGDVSGAALSAAAMSLAQKNSCVACHGMDKKIIGPGFLDIAKKYAARADAVDYLAGKIKVGGAGVWGPVPMPAQNLAEADARTIAQWLAQGAKK
ncbi:MAG: c-type cytochrome [Variovorax sp.]